MGLEIVELIMTFEDEFDVGIPDDVAPELRTPRQVADYLVSVLGERACPPGHCEGARSFYRLRQQLVTRYGTPRSAVRPDEAIGALVPTVARRDWPRIADAAGLRRERCSIFQSDFPPADMPLFELIRTRSKRPWRRPDGSVSPDAVLARVCAIVAEQMGVPVARVRHDTDFVRDLGMG